MAGKELVDEELFEEHVDVENLSQEEFVVFDEHVDMENLAEEELFEEHVEELGKQLQCTLCSQPYRKPRLLPCLHSFCESCLEDHQRDVCGEGEGLTCPVTFCQNPTDEVVVQNFTTNIWLKNRISINEKVVAIVEGPCDICVKRTKATAYCTDCRTAMCGDCQTNWHDRNRANKDHKPIPITTKSVDALKATLTRQVQSEAQEEQQCCSQHGEKQCEFFCYECNKPFCSFCLFAGACKGHQCDCIPDVVETFKEELSSHLQSHNDSLEELDKAIASCENIKKRISTREGEVEEEINTAVKAIMDAVMKQKKQLMDQCHELAQSKRTRLDLQIEQLMRTKQQIEHCSEVISSACDSYSSTEFLSVKDAIISRHEDLNTKFEDVELLPCTTATIVAELDSDVDLGFVSEGCCPELSVLEVPVGQPFTCEIGDESQIRLVTRYEDENLCDLGGATVEATLSISGSVIPLTQTATTVTTTDNHDGTYSLFFTPTLVGNHQLNVEIFGCKIKGSPFQVKVSSECKEIQALMNKRLFVGENRYLVSHEWITKWKQYYQPSCFGNQDFHPGPVKNSTLKCDTVNVDGECYLKSNLTVGRDYDHLPQLAWDKLVARYGLSKGSEPIVRTVAQNDHFSWQLEVEVYPLMLKIRRGSGTAHMFTFSRNDTVCDVKNKAYEKFVAPSCCRLKRNQYSSPLLEYQKLSALGIKNEEALFLEIQSSDGRWS